MAQLDIDALPQVAVGFMNEDHREEARLLNAVTAALSALCEGRRAGGGDAGLARAGAPHPGALRAGGARHGPDRLPALRGAPGRARARALRHGGGAERLRGGRRGGRLARYVEIAMPAWFLRHIETMDFVTARFLAARGV